MNTWIVSSVDRLVVLKLDWSYGRLSFSLEKTDGTRLASHSFFRSETRIVGIPGEHAEFSSFVKKAHEYQFSAESVSVLYYYTIWTLQRWLEEKNL